HCHWLMHIPTHEEHISMNLGQAVAVCLYEVSRETKMAGRTSSRPVAGAAELERITSALAEALVESGYTTPRTQASAEGKVRRLLRRLQFQPEDATTFSGMLKQILWKLRSD